MQRYRQHNISVALRLDLICDESIVIVMDEAELVDTVRHIFDNKNTGGVRNGLYARVYVVLEKTHEYVSQSFGCSLAKCFPEDVRLVNFITVEIRDVVRRIVRVGYG